MRKRSCSFADIKVGDYFISLNDLKLDFELNIYMKIIEKNNINAWCLSDDGANNKFFEERDKVKKVIF